MSIVDFLLRRRRRVVSGTQRWFARVDVLETPGWVPLFDHALAAAGRSRPSQRFLRDGHDLIEALEVETFRAELLRWLREFDLALPNWREKDDVNEEREIMRGLLWLSAPIATDPLCSALGDFSLRCFKKITDHGPTAPKLGNAAVLALALVPGGSGLGVLGRVKGEIKYPSARRQVDRFLGEAAKRVGVSRDELEEMSVPTFELNNNGKKDIDIGDYAAELSVEGTRAVLHWRNSKGKRLKSVPSSLRSEHAGELAAIRKQAKELGATVTAQATRLERLFLRKTPLTVGVLLQRYLKHPLIGPLARRLVWRVDTSDGMKPLLWRDRFECLGKPIEVSTEALVWLWHPCDADAIDDVLVWRDWLAELGITQPFAQLYREVYRAEPDSSATANGADDRFAGHVLLQKALRPKCQTLGWSYLLQGYWDSANSPTLELPEHELIVSFDTDAVPHRDDDHAFAYLISGAVRFDGRPLGEISPRVFSECMRMVANLISDSSVSIEEGFGSETWASFSEQFERGAWGNLAPAAIARASVLADVLPRTTLEACTLIDGRWLVVKPDKTSEDATFRIHMGSAMVRDGADNLVEVRSSARSKRNASQVVLPFEGDALLRKILARAFELAAR